MKIIRISGCTADVFTVDGIDFEYLSDMDKINVLTKILKRVTKEAYKDVENQIIDLLDYIAPDKHDMDDKPCDQCGDYMIKEEWKI